VCGLRRGPAISPRRWLARDTASTGSCSRSRPSHTATPSCSKPPSTEPSRVLLALLERVSAPRAHVTSPPTALTVGALQAYSPARVALLLFCAQQGHTTLRRTAAFGLCRAALLRPASPKPARGIRAPLLGPERGPEQVFFFRLCGSRHPAWRGGCLIAARLPCNTLTAIRMSSPMRRSAAASAAPALLSAALLVSSASSGLCFVAPVAAPALRGMALSTTSRFCSRALEGRDCRAVSSQRAPRASDPPRVANTPENAGAQQHPVRRCSAALGACAWRTMPRPRSRAETPGCGSTLVGV